MPKTITENGAIRKRSPEWSDLKTMLFENAVFWVWTEKTMLSENGDVINVNTTRRQTTRLLVFKIARRRNHYGFSLDRRCSVHGREKNDTKTVSVDAIFLKTEQNSSVFVWKRSSVDKPWVSKVISQLLWFIGWVIGLVLVLRLNWKSLNTNRNPVGIYLSGCSLATCLNSKPEFNYLYMQTKKSSNNDCCC